MTFQEFKEKYQKKEVQEISSAVSKKPLVSVLVQTYQQKDFIRECLNSIFIQKTTFDFEILIGDDGSTDGTREICMEYAEKYPEKIRLFLHHRENQIKVMGEPTSNFNAFYNFYSAKGKYIAFCEGDDTWGDPLKLQKQVEFLEQNPDFVLSFHGFDEMQNKMNLTTSPELEQVLQNVPGEKLQRLVSHPLLFTICFRNIINELPRETIEIINVDSFFLSILGQYGGAKYHNDILPGIYRRHSGGAWTGRTKEIKFHTKISTFAHLSIFYEQQNKTDLHKYFKAIIRNHKKMLFMHYTKNMEFLKAIRLILTM